MKPSAGTNRPPLDGWSEPRRRARSRFPGLAGANVTWSPEAGLEKEGGQRADEVADEGHGGGVGGATCQKIKFQVQRTIEEIHSRCELKTVYLSRARVRPGDGSVGDPPRRMEANVADVHCRGKGDMG